MKAWVTLSILREVAAVPLLSLLPTLSGTSVDPVRNAIWPLGSNISAAVPAV